MHRFFGLSLAGLVLSASAPAFAGAIVKSIPGPDGGWDYARVDPAKGRLYVAREASITVVDLKGGGPVHSIGQVAHGHSVIPIPGSETIVVTSGADATVRFLDGESGKEEARLTVGANPDAAVVDQAGKTLFTMNAKAGTISKIDIATRKLVATITLKPGLEYNALTPDGTLFVNNEDENSLTVVDTRANSVSATIPLTGCEGPSGLAYDARSARLIAACDNGKAAIVDARTKTLVGLLDIGQGPDAVILDAQRRKAYIPCGKSGELDIVSLDAEGGPAVIGHIETEAGARTGALDPTDGMVYLPTGKFGPAAAGEKRGAFMAGSFHILAIRP